MRRLHDSLVGGLRRVMAFDGFRADPFLGDKFYRWTEEVVEQAPFGAVKIVEEIDRSYIVQSFVSYPLPYMAPVLLFDMGVVVFVVGPAPCEYHPSFRKVSQEVMIQKLRAVVAVESEEGKGQ